MPEATIQTEWLSGFARGLWRYIRPRFALAGQDSFTDPPAQNEDMFESLVNVMPPVQGDIDRRWGYRAWNTSAPQGAASIAAAYPVSLWANDPPTTRNVAVSTGTGQTLYSESGQPLYKLTYSGAPGVRSVSSRGNLFSVDGVQPRKWTPTLVTATQQWGTDVNNVSGGTTGPNAPSTVTDLGGSGTSGSQGPLGAGTGSNMFDGDVDWQNPGNITAEDGQVSTAVFVAGQSLLTSSNLRSTSFGFAIPGSATIIGIQVDVKRRASGVGITDNIIQLLKAGTPTGTSKGGSPWSTTLGFVTFGSASDLWGTTWTPSDINNVNFGVNLQCNNASRFGGTASVDFVRMTVFYSGVAASSWSNPNNIKIQDGLVTTATSTVSPTSDLQATNFGFAAFPAGTVVTGIQVDIKCSTSGANPILAPILVKGGTTVGTRKSTPITGTSLGFVTFGGSDDLWGTSWLPGDISVSTFGTQFQTYTVSGSATLSVDFVRITIWTRSSGITIGAFSGTGVTLVSGRRYTYSFYNSMNGPHYSDLGPFTASTGPVTNQSIPLSTIPVSLDGQIDRKLVLATGDGGDETVLYTLADLPNATTTFTDNIPEASLILTNQFQAVLSDGTSVGVADNSPPPAGMLYPLLHRGRVFGLNGSDLVFSKSDAELFMPTGNIAGNFEEAFPATNAFPVTSTGEQGRGLLSDGTVLYIGTDRRVLRLFGDGPQTFLKPETIFDNVGILNQDVWKMVLIEGNPVGAMWLTPDYRVLGSDFNTYQDVGIPVQNVLDSVNRAAARKSAWAVDVNISIFNLYVLAVPTGSNTQPDTLLVFDIKGRKWYQWQLTDTVVGGFWWVTLDGQPAFIIQANNGKLYIFDTSILQDRVNDTPVSFPVTLRTSWLAMGDGTARKQLNEMEVTTGDSAMTVTIEGASTLAGFNAPNLVVTAAPLVTKPRGELGVFLAGAKTRDRYYRFTFNATDATTDLLRGFNVQGRVIHRL